MCLAEGLVLGGVGVHQRSDVLGVRLPVVDQLRLAHELSGAGADDVDADHGAVGDPDELDETLGLEDLALAAAGQVVCAWLLRVLTLRWPGGPRAAAPRGDLGVAVGDARDA